MARNEKDYQKIKAKLIWLRLRLIYTMGVVINQGDRIVTDVIKGYGYLSNAQEMLLDATKIFKLQGNTEGACIYNVRDGKLASLSPLFLLGKIRRSLLFILMRLLREKHVESKVFMESDRVIQRIHTDVVVWRF